MDRQLNIIPNKSQSRAGAWATGLPCLSCMGMRHANVRHSGHRQRTALAGGHAEQVEAALET
eukprot:scaffold9802_cov100-Isochrysis_galbana.AAC.1